MITIIVAFILGLILGFIIGCKITAATTEREEQAIAVKGFFDTMKKWDIKG